MKLEELCCSLDFAHKLKALGVKQESLFCWCHCNDDSYELEYDIYDYKLQSEYISAFTASELGELLPFCLKIDEKEYFLRSMFGFTHHEKNTTISYNFTVGDTSIEVIGFDFCASTEANARAKMLIHLIENKLIDLRQ